MTLVLAEAERNIKLAAEINKINKMPVRTRLYWHFTKRFDNSRRKR